jgi:hypothetical protein
VAAESAGGLVPGETSLILDVVSDTEPEERAPLRSRLFGKDVTVPSHPRHSV